MRKRELSHLFVEVHGVYVSQAGANLGPVPEDALEEVLLLEVERQAAVAGTHHATCLPTLEAALVVTRAACRRAVVRRVSLPASKRMPGAPHATGHPTRGLC